MASEAGISLVDGELAVFGNSVLTDVHDNIFLTPAKNGSLVNGTFIGVQSDQIGSRCVFPVGKLEGLRFMCLYRFKLWWMTQLMGRCGHDIPFEIQFLMVEVNADSHLRERTDNEEAQSVFYTIFLPILEGDFRAVLQVNANNELEICLESGDLAVQEFEGKELVFIAAGLDPYNLMQSTVKYLETHLQTFCHRDKKKIPDSLNWFGWCTWDAFYTDVTAEGVKNGLESLQKGGTPTKFVIIDDGWQTVDMDPTSVEAKADCTANFANRLTHITENNKFRQCVKESHSVDYPASGLVHFVAEIKNQYALKYVYVWHAITGYWGGVKPDVTAMRHYDSKLIDPISSPGIESNGICFVLKSIIRNRVGLVNPDKVFTFYDELHSYLASAGVNGVKVDVQSILETLGAGHGGRVELARKYHQALEKSVCKNFPENGIISCMSHNTDSLYSAKRTAVVRASDDFFPRDPASHTIHIASVAYNTLFIGEFMQPDWDMFHSLHPMAEYHGAARAVGGCAIYISDKPGQHDFDLLKKLVLPDGSILRAKLPGRPTRDCLFSDPTQDAKKIWNLNEYTGVLGVFNCQGAAWSRVEGKNSIHNEQPETISSIVQTKDVEYLDKLAGDGWSGDAILYSLRGGQVVYLPKRSFLKIQLRAREYEVFTVVPVKQLSGGATFAPIGLVKMFNSGGAIQELKYETKGVRTIDLRVRGCGMFGAYSSVKPKRVLVDKEEMEFGYQNASGLVTLLLSIPKEELYQWNMTIEI